MLPHQLLSRSTSVVLFLCLFVAAGQAAAQSVLSGTVFGGGSPLGNTLVEALNDGTTTVAGSSTTNAAGQYSISLADGTYDLRVTPPAGSGFGVETVQNVTLAGDRTYDVILLAAGAGQVSGDVRGHGGAPIAGASVSVYTANWQFLTSATTDANGHYQVPVSGTVHIQFNGSDWSATPIAPRSWGASRTNLPVAGSMTLDITLPVARVSGTVRDPNGNAVSGASLEAYGSPFDMASLVSYNFSANATTNASGNYDYLVLSSSTNVTVRPPSGSGLTPLSESVLVAGDATKDFTLAAAIMLTGTVRGYGGAAISGASVTTYTSSWQFLASATTDASGQYAVAVAAGTSHVQFNGSDWSATPIAPRSWGASRTNLPVAGSMTLDITLPVARVSGTVRDPNGNAVSGASLEAYGSPFDMASLVSYNFSANATTNASGNYDYLVLSSSTNVTVRPPSGSGLTPLSESVLVAGDATKDFTLAAAIMLTGTVRGYGGAAISGASVTTYTSSWQFLASATTDASGQYAVAVAAGTSHVQFNGSDWSATPIAPRSWGASRTNLPVAGSMTLDITLPVARLDGVTTDSNGAPVPNVSLEAYGSPFDMATLISFNYSASVTSGPTGNYEMMLLKAPASFTLRPPNNSGFLPTSLSPNITGDVTQRIVLQRPDLSPPLIITGPVVVHLSDTSASIAWTTNEASTSVVDYGAGPVPTATVATPGLVTNHAVTLQGLDPVTSYQFRVSSSDAAGNGPAYGYGSFTTLLSPGDITPPSIIAGPSVVFVDQTTAIVQWETDEPATSTVAFGISGLDGSVSGPAGVFTTAHSITLTGLTAATVYTAQVTSADPDGNSTSSSLFPITTLAAPDTAAPVILTGPTILSTTDTQIIVEWTTNEPATSGVSFNDGVHFDVVSDSALTTTHQVTLSGLTPSTTYHITVSSTDAVGNGPTLGGPVDATTDAEADTTAPVISNVTVTQITESSAVISWTTDEPATSVVNYGLTPAAADGTRADLSPVTTHSLTLTGLLDGTQYFFTLRSTDSSGNTATTTVADFTTESSYVDQPPTKPGPITGPPSPSNLAAFTLTWGASTDDLLLTGYQLLRDGAVVASFDAFTTSHDEAALGEGQHIFVVRATDNGGHATDSDPFTITIDRTAPMVTVPEDTVLGTQGTAAAFDYDASASDNLDGPIAVVCDPAVSSFAIGVTTVTCSAQDAAGNRGEASFTVTVEDEGAPTLVMPVSQILEVTGPGGALAVFAPSATDLVDGVITPVCTPPSGTFFPLGTTTVGCTATDQAGNSASGQLTITVLDTHAPVIGSVRPSQGSLWPPNHQMVGVAINVAVTDVGDAAPVCRISDVSSNEPIDGLGDGDTSPDWMGVSGLAVSLRAERSGKGNGRIYTIGVTCQDGSGNVSRMTTVVTVPKSQSGK